MKSDNSYILYIKQNKLLKKVYNNIMNSIVIKHNGYYIMNYESSKTCDPHRLLPNLANKINSKKW